MTAKRQGGDTQDTCRASSIATVVEGASAARDMGARNEQSLDRSLGVRCLRDCTLGRLRVNPSDEPSQVAAARPLENAL